MVKPVTVSAENELALERPPYGLAGLVALLLLVLYVATIGPTTQFWDTSEYIAAAKVLGIPHPPGNPLFVLLASVWGMLPIAASYALRINLLAATTSALASGFLFLVADRFLRDTMAAPQWVRRATAFAGVFVAATSFTVWNQSTANEKVYTVSLLSIALVLWITVHWGDDTPGPHRDRWLVLIGYLLTLGSTNHMMGVLVTPAVGIYVLGTDLREATRPWVLAMGFAFALAVTGAWCALVDGPAELKFAILAGAVTLAVYTAVRDSREFARPMLYIAIGAVAVGISLNYNVPPDSSEPLPADQRGGAHQLAVPPGGPESGSVRQAAPVDAPGRLRIAARELLAVLHLAIRTGLGRAGASRPGRGVRGHRAGRRPAPVAAEPTRRTRHDRAHGDVYRVPDLLPQFQERVLDPPR